MANLNRVYDSLNDARDARNGINALACLLKAVNEADVPEPSHIADILFALEQQLRDNLEEIDKNLRK